MLADQDLQARLIERSGVDLKDKWRVIENKKADAKPGEPPLPSEPLFDAVSSEIDTLNVVDSDSAQTSCFTVVLPKMFAFLASLFAAGVLPQWVMQADHTFKVEWMRYVWGSFGAVVYRCLARRWRKT